MVVALCVILVAVSGCGQEESGNIGKEQSVNRVSDAVTGIETADVFENEDPFDDSETIEEDSHTIYQCFLNGEEPLYFREATIFNCPSSDFRYYVEVNRLYKFYKICNIINMASTAAPR